MRFEFYGSSDDNFCWHNGTSSDEISSYRGPAICKVLDDRLLDGLFVVGHYAPGEGTPGCWSVGIMQLDEDVPLPDWKYSFESRNYTTVLVIETTGTAHVLQYLENVHCIWRTSTASSTGGNSVCGIVWQWKRPRSQNVGSLVPAKRVKKHVAKSPARSCLVRRKRLPSI